MIATLLAFPDEVSIVTPEAQNALVEIFRVLERVGGKAPSNAVVFAAVRGIDIAFPDGEAKRLLASFRNARPGGAPHPLPVRPASAPEIKHERPSEAPETPLPRPDDAGATCARDKVLLVPKLGESVSPAFSPGMQFGSWFFESAIAAGAITDHGFETPTGYAYKNHEFADALIAVHGMDECKLRAGRMIAWKMRTGPNRLGMAVSLRNLAQRCWDMLDRDDAGTPRVAPPAPSAQTEYGAKYLEKLNRRLEAVK